jgi:hypothetical protein
MNDINQIGNIFDASKLLIKGGSDATYFEVVHVSDQIVSYSDYPSIKDGKLMSWTESEWWKYKVKRTRQAIQLTVTGNAVCCEGELKEMGYEAAAINPNCVMVILPESNPATEIN